LTALVEAATTTADTTTCATTTSRTLTGGWESPRACERSLSWSDAGSGTS